MPLKKSKSTEGLPTKIIKVKKLDSVKTINELEKTVTIPKDSIINSNIKIMEPIVEIIDNETNMTKSDSIDTIDKSTLKVKNNSLKPKAAAAFRKNRSKSDDKHTGNNNDDNDNDDNNDDDNDDNDDHDDNDDNDDNDVDDDKDNDYKESPKTVKEQKTDKIHNHSKPKTIIASTKDVNTVDMFGEDDLDFRYVMMNYDYTKNVTMAKITKYERALLIGKRAKQIEEGANPNVKYISGQSVVSIAEEELRQRKIPLIIKRPIGNKFEYWKPADMEVNMD